MATGEGGILSKLYPENSSLHDKRIFSAGQNGTWQARTSPANIFRVDSLWSCTVYVWSSHIAGIRINRVRLPVLHVSAELEKCIFPCPRSCLRIWSRETGSAVLSRVSLLISILRLNLVLTYGTPPNFRYRRAGQLGGSAVLSFFYLFGNAVLAIDPFQHK